MADIRVFETAHEAQRAAAQILVAAARAGEHLALSGGEAPGPAFELAAELEPDWSAARLWWGDERCVPPDDERSNYLLAKRTLLDRIEKHPAEIHRIRGELGGEAAAAEYDRELEGVDASGSHSKESARTGTRRRSFRARRHWTSAKGAPSRLRTRRSSA